MAIGVSTYAYQHRMDPAAPQPMSVLEVLHDVADLGAEVFQVCDQPTLENLTPAAAQELREAAAARGLILESGTRGTAVDHLRKHLALALSLGVVTVRSMAFTADDRPTHAEIVERLKVVVPEYEAAGVRLGLETYEQLTTTELLAIVDAVDSPNLGIVLDPANCVANVEDPRDVVRRLARRVVNIHVKDFRFTRRDGWAGFTLASCPLGEGQLDYRDLLAVVQPDPARVHQILEHWLVPQGDVATTCATEADWTARSLRTLDSYRSVA